LGLNILLSSLFSNTLSLWFSLDIRYQVSHPYKATSKIIVVHILCIYMFIRYITILMFTF
jgi:hypothetical protein